MANTEYWIVEDQMDPNGTLKWAEFAQGDGFVQITAVLDSEDDTLIDEAATQKKVNDWVEASKPWDELV